MKNYHYHFTTTSTPYELFKALTGEIPCWWSEDFSGKALDAGDEFTVRFGDTFKTIMIEDSIPQKKLTWRCKDAVINIPEQKGNREWVNTIIEWDIKKEDNHTRLSVTHYGLTPEKECFQICEKGWETFLQSLKQYAETKTGIPYTKPS